MRRIPCAQFCNRDLEQLMRLRSTVQSNNSLTDAVATDFWNHVDPAHVVEGANDETVARQCERIYV